MVMDFAVAENYLCDLYKQISKLNKDRKTKMRWESFIRKLTDEEWKEIQNILDLYCIGQIENQSLICSMGTASFGFTCCMYIEKIIEPIYPGIPFDFKFLITISSKHLVGDIGGSFEKGWESFYPYTHHEANIRNLKRCGRKLPGRKSEYEY